jgi:hypothetical protein
VAHRVGEALAVVALVEIEAGLVAAGDVDGEAPAVLDDLNLGRRRRRLRRTQPARRRASPSRSRADVSLRS